MCCSLGRNERGLVHGGIARLSSWMGPVVARGGALGTGVFDGVSRGAGRGGAAGLARVGAGARDGVACGGESG